MTPWYKTLWLRITASAPITVVVAAGDDARSRLVSLTPAGREKRAEAKRRWKVAQEGINRLLGVEQVVALHALIDASMEKLDPVDVAEDGDHVRRWAWPDPNRSLLSGNGSRFTSL